MTALWWLISMPIAGVIMVGALWKGLPDPYRQSPAQRRRDLQYRLEAKRLEDEAWQWSNKKDEQNRILH